MSTAVLEVKGGLGGDAGYRVGEVSGTVGLWGGRGLYDRVPDPVAMFAR